jgi:glycosyltransferase involved in cell wall biosynthesis
MLVSIGIPCYNRPESIGRLLYSLQQQTHRELEIIVSDNCSPNEQVWAVISKAAEEDHRIVPFRQERNLGAIANHDFVRDKATSNYFIWMHDDDEFPPDFIACLVETLASQPSATLVGPSCDRFLNGKWWLRYENWDSVGRTTFERLHDLIPDGFYYHWRFEQYLSGLFRIDAAPKRVSPHFKSQFHHFFTLSAHGPILHCPSVLLSKHTTDKELLKYAAGSTYSRLRFLRWFSSDTPESIQQCVPITLGMLKVSVTAPGLTVLQKFRLCFRILVYFIRCPVRNELLAWGVLQPFVYLKVWGGFHVKRLLRLVNKVQGWVTRRDY